MMHLRRETEVLVAGGGPAGLAAAIAARQAGFEVLVVDHARPPIDKACGEGIMPQGISALSALGICISQQEAARFRGVRFLQPGFSVAASFRDEAGLGVRRTTLHEAMVDSAARAGVSMWWGARVSGMSRDGLVVEGQGIRCRWVIGADGQNSQVRRWAGLNASGQVRRRFGLRRHFEVEPWSDFVDVHWSDFGQLYITPVAADEVCVAFLTRHQHLRFKDVFDLFPDVGRRLMRARSAEKGAVTSIRTLRSVTNEHCALIGDASGSVDAITGEGLSLAFRQALVLASALKSNDLCRYERVHSDIARVPGMMARLMLLMDSRPALRRRVLDAFAAEPEQFQRMLAVHIGAMPLAGFGLGRAASLGWKVLVG